MADNVVLPGTGKIVAAEEIAGVDYQRMKVVNGTVGDSTPLIVEADGSIKMGTDITTPAAMPAGGAGVRGWLSAIFTSIGIVTAAVWDGAAATSSVMSYLRYQGVKLEAIRLLLTGNLGVVVQNASIAVTGAFYQATQPVSGAFYQATQPVSFGTRTVKVLYGGSTTITISPASVVTTASRQSAVIDFSASLYFDALVSVKIKSGAASTSATGVVNVYAYATADGGTTYTDGASGSDAAMTLTSPTNLRWIGTINVVANATTYFGGPFSVAAAFGGVMPQKWGIVLENKSGGTLDSSAGSHVVTYQGVQSQEA